MSLQQIIPVVIALATAFAFRRRLTGAQTRWLCYPLTAAVAVSIGAIVGIIQFWMPQIAMGFGAKGLPLIVFGIVGARAALPAAICIAVLLTGIALVELLRRQRAGREG